jgi:N-acetylglucosamine-6-phosphate deacetylase
VDLVLHGGTIVTPEAVLERAWLAVTGGVVSAIGQGAPPPGPGVDMSGRTLVPGFVDIHCHGGGGADFSDPDPERARAAALTHRRAGTTSLVASLVSRPVADLVDQVAALADLVEDGEFAGIHLEGPFLSAARCGAHDPSVLQPPDTASIEKLLAAGRGTVRQVTLAPELPGSLDAIRQLTDAGVVAALGHTDAGEDTIRPAVEAGARVATHLYNGMRPLHHREPGAVGALLDDERVVIELICDLIHVAPTAVRIAASHAGPRRTVLVTDAMSATGMSDGVYQLGTLQVTVIDGAPRLPDGTIAASTLTMGGAFARFVRDVGMRVRDAVSATAALPAEILGIDGRPGGVGELSTGMAADIAVLDGDLCVRRVLRDGGWVE